MKPFKYVIAATALLFLVGPALAQTDAHHPDSTTAPAAEAMTPAKPSDATTSCPDMMMNMMQQGMTGASQMQMMQMMQMMQSMQAMQMNMMQQMQKMQQMQGGKDSADKTSP
jgi:hypothetical protein